MSKQDQAEQSKSRTELPIERGFPIELVNDISERENYGGARQHYRPCYTMHKWWAPRTGAVFRTICLYSLFDDPEEVDVRKPGTNGRLSDFSESSESVADMMNSVSMEQPDTLWPLYAQDTRVTNKRVLIVVVQRVSGNDTRNIQYSSIDGINFEKGIMTKKLQIRAGGATYKLHVLDQADTKEAMEYMREQTKTSKQERPKQRGQRCVPHLKTQICNRLRCGGRPHR